MYKKVTNFLTLFLLTTSLFCTAQPPTATVVIVIDQLAFHYLHKLKDHLCGGLADLMKNGVSYTNAYHPHALPETAVGHATISTGACASDHGIVGNKWMQPDGSFCTSDDDTVQNAPVLAQNNGLYDYGKSAHNLIIDTLSDQIILSNHPNNTCNVYAISLKSRSAIMMAGKLGQAYWFDTSGRAFTSSTAYGETLPLWLTQFNKKSQLQKINKISWRPFFPYNKLAYAFKNIDNYDFSDTPAMINTTTPITNPKTLYDDPLVKSPLGSQITFDCARSCLLNHRKTAKKNPVLLWLSISSLDLTGHAFGPDAREAIDLIYHIDKQLKKFMQFVTKKFGKNNTLFVLTGDHGITPIPELLEKQGIPARRLFAQEWITEMNTEIEQKFALKNLIRTDFYAPFLYLDPALFTAIDPTIKKKIYASIKKYLIKKDGIKQVWSADELANLCFSRNQIEQRFKNQLFLGRSGTIVVQTEPYNLLTTYTHGASHSTPYEPDTHVPLIVYQRNRFEKKQINDYVEMTQLAPTLAHILNVPKPSSATTTLLPGLLSDTTQEQQCNQ